MNNAKGARNGSFMLFLELAKGSEKMTIFDIPTEVVNRTNRHFVALGSHF